MQPVSQIRTHALMICMCVLIACGFFVTLRAAPSTGTHKQANPFRTYQIDTGWGAYDADFSPDGRFLAVDSYRGEYAADKTKLIEQEQVQIWDFRNRSLVSSKTLWEQRPPAVTNDASLNRGFVRYIEHGKKILVCACNEGRLLVLDSKTLAQVSSINLGKLTWPRQWPNAVLYVEAVEVDQEDTQARAAVLVGLKEYSWGQVRIYDLNSGNLIAYRSFSSDIGGISIDPAGKRVAVALLPFSPGERPLRRKERNVVILDADTGKPITEINTGYLAATVRFVGSDTVATVSAEYGLGGHKKDGIRLCDVKTGRLLREILSPPTGVRYHLEVSEDGKTALGYTTKEVNHWWWFDPASVIAEYARFRLWDLATGRVIATSPDLSSMIAGSDFALSPKGDVVLIYPVNSGGPLVFYELKHTP